MSKLTITELESIVASLGGVKALATSQSATSRMVRDLLDHYELRSRFKRSLVNCARSTASHLRDVADRLDAGADAAERDGDVARLAEMSFSSIQLTVDEIRGAAKAMLRSES